jgi:ribosomal protein S18 acetylase RimI-like enzyme
VNLTIKFLESDSDGRIKELTKECDEDFYPKLSYRGESLKSMDAVSETDLGIDPYYNKMIKTNRIVAACDPSGHIVGYMAYKEGFDIDDGLVERPSVNYVTTICVGKKYRKNGICRRLYEFVIENSKNDVLVRTWSENTSHIKVIEKIGFTQGPIFINHRGEGVDTLYFNYACKI